MNDLLKSLFALIDNEEVLTLLLNVEITEDENGKVTIVYQKPMTPKEVTEFKNYIDVMDDSIFEEAAAICKKSYPETFKELSNDKVTNLTNFNLAVTTFKKVVKEVCNTRITLLKQSITKEQAEIKEYEKYLK